MKLNKIYILILFIWISKNTSLSAQELYIKVPIDNQGNFEALYSAERYIAEPFKVGLNLPNIIVNCQKAKITYVVPNEVQFLSIYSSGYSIISQTNNTVIVESDASNLIVGNSNLDVGFRVRYTGDICENIPVEIDATIDYLDANGNICSSYDCTPITIIPKYDNDTHSGSVYDMTDSRDLCKGGYHRNRIMLSKINTEGGYNLNNVNGTIELTGQVIDVQCSYSNFAYQISNTNSCENVINFTFDKWKINEGLSIVIIYSTQCACGSSSSVPFDNHLEVNISGSDPCGTQRNVTFDYSRIVNNECCAEGTVTPLYSEGLDGQSIQQWCASACNEFIYYDNFSNYNSPFTVKNYSVLHHIPVQLKMDAVYVDYSYQNSLSSYPVEICYTLSGTPSVWNCVMVDETNVVWGKIIFTDSPANYPYMTLYKPASENIEKIQFNYNYDIPAWANEDVHNYFSFRIADNSPIPAEVYSEVSFDRYLNGLFHESVSFSPNYQFPDYRCLPGYQTYPYINPSTYNNYNGSASVSSYPTDIETLAIRIVNRGSGASPTSLTIRLPDEVEYAGDLSMYSGINNTAASQFSPPSVVEQISYDATSHSLIWSNLSVPPICGSDLFCKIVKFKIEVKPGTYTGTYKTEIVIGGRTQNSQYVHVLEKLLVKGYISRRCPNGSEVLNDIEVAAGEEIQLNYHLTNEGNVKIRDFLISSMIPSVGDFSYQANNTTVLSRNSELDFSFSNNQAGLVGIDIGFHSSVSDVEQFQGQNNNYQEQVFQAILQGEILPGDSKLIPLNISIPQNANLGERAYNDFYYFGYDASVINTDLPIQGLSEMTNFLIANVNNCPIVQDCAEESDLATRLQNAFNVSVNGSNVEVSAQNLLPNERWFPIWEGSDNGGAGYHWGDGTYASTYNYSSVGEHHICIVVENMQYENNLENGVCHCDYYCTIITIQ